jgi:hypothetical protein
VGHAAEVAGSPKLLVEPRLAPLGQGTRGLVVGLVAGLALVEGMLHVRTRAYQEKERRAMGIKSVFFQNRRIAKKRHANRERGLSGEHVPGII